MRQRLKELVKILLLAFTADITKELGYNIMSMILEMIAVFSMLVFVLVYIFGIQNIIGHLNRLGHQNYSRSVSKPRKKKVNKKGAGK